MEILKNIKALAFGLVVLLLIVSVSVNSCQRKQLIKRTTELVASDTENNIIKKDNMLLIDSLENNNKKIIALQETSKIIIKQRDSVINENRILRKQLAEVPSYVNSISEDSSYKFLYKVAYPFLGENKYIFNGIQVKRIHSDFLQKIKLVQLVDGLDKQIKITEDKLYNTELQGETLQNSLTICEEMSSNSSTIISNLENNNAIIKKQSIKQERSKKIWRFIAGVATAGLITSLL